MIKIASSPIIYGIRHHGPGSARSLLAAFADDKPDIILVEGPPDANDMLHWLAQPEMEPPISLVVYRPDMPKRASYFPFAAFSPEYQAVCYAFQQKIPARFIDIPQAHYLAITAKVEGPNLDPMTQLAQIAGFPNHEAWWNQLVEQRQDGTDLFEGILNMMTTVRDLVEQTSEDANSEAAEPPESATRLAEQREAFMRQAIRQAQHEGFQRIAVVCGAWHAPALTDLDPAYPDQVLLEDIPTAEVEMAWVPWTYGRLASFTGYGAGIKSPGWYHHLWEMGQVGATPTDISIHWLRQVANLLREDGLDASAAHVIEAVRLAESLAAMRNQPLPGLAELNEATQTVICFGDATPLHRVQAKLIVGERMGAVPPDSPMVPLQRDLAQQQKQLNLLPEPERITLNLDLRNVLDLARSHLLHRLQILDIGWGKPISTKSHPGTYREIWHLQWRPDNAIRVIEANIWGNTVEIAAITFAQDVAERADNITTLTQLLDQVILAELPEAVASVMSQIEAQVALSSDIPRLMEALPPLANVLRYGSVRKTDKTVVQQVVDGMVRRICLGLPNTCASMDDQAAADMHDRIVQMQAVISTLPSTEHETLWRETLLKLVDQKSLHGLIAGRVCRLLLDTRVFSVREVTVRLERALSLKTIATASLQNLMQVAFWLEGFLRDSGLLLIHDQTLWNLLDMWLTQLDDTQFMNLLPLLRRTFSSFSEGVRQQLTQRIQQLDHVDAPTPITVAFDEVQADKVLPLVAQLLGLPR